MVRHSRQEEILYTGDFVQNIAVQEQMTEKSWIFKFYPCCCSGPLMTIRDCVPAAQSKAQGGHSSGKPGKVRELKSGQGKVRENELLQIFSCGEHCSDINKMISYTFVYGTYLYYPTGVYWRM